MPRIMYVNDPPYFEIYISYQENPNADRLNSVLVAFRETPGATEVKIADIGTFKVRGIPVTAANVIALMELKPDWDHVAALKAVETLAPLAKQAVLFAKAATDMANNDGEQVEN